MDRTAHIRAYLQYCELSKGFKGEITFTEDEEKGGKYRPTTYYITTEAEISHSKKSNLSELHSQCPQNFLSPHNMRIYNPNKQKQSPEKLERSCPF